MLHKTSYFNQAAGKSGVRLLRTFPTSMTDVEIDAEKKAGKKFMSAITVQIELPGEGIR